MEREKESLRLAHYDTLKFLAILMIAGTHYINAFCPEVFALWGRLPYSLVLYGISGKLGVSLLGVIMCRFAGQPHEKNALKYLIKRYLYFIVGGLVINILYFVFGLCSHKVVLLDIIPVSLSLSAGIFPTFWCMRDFLAASFLAYLNGRYRIKARGILLQIVILSLIGQHWIAICLLGSLVGALSDHEKIKRILDYRLVRILLGVLVFVLIKRSESVETYYIDGLCMAGLLLLTESSSLLREILAKPKMIALAGRYTMSLFLIHNFIYSMTERILSAITMTSLFHGIRLIICVVLCAVGTFVMQYILIAFQSLTERCLPRLFQENVSGDEVPNMPE